MAGRYNQTVHPVPTLLITGADRAAKTVFLRALLAIRPARERWALLDNDGNLPAEGSMAHDLSIASVSGCACCTGQVALQTGIVRLLRESRPQRLVIVVAAAAEPAALTQALRQEHLTPALRLVRNQCIAAATLQSAGDSAHGLWLRQMQAADEVVAVDDDAAAALSGLALHVIGTAEAIALALAGMARTARG
jgi:G3E family GTPase